jgi:hypothetical protein
MAIKGRFISGTCQQLLFSPKGGVEGVLVREKGTLVQVSMQADIGAVFARVAGPGSRVSVLAEADHSPKTQDSTHPVFQFASFADTKGTAIDPPDDDSAKTSIEGVVAALHYARHGQPNGVILESGEFVHLRPGGMAKAALRVGSKVRAVGDLRMTLLGSRLLEAHKINGTSLD